MKALQQLVQAPTVDRVLRWGSLGLLIWLVVLVLGAGAQSLHTSGRAAGAILEYQRIQAEAAGSDEDMTDAIRRLQRNNLFVAAPNRAQLPQTQAILGDSVLIGDRWYREGQEVQGYRIVTVGPESVTVLLDGQEQRLSPFDVEVNYGQAAGRGGAAGGGDRGRDIGQAPQRGQRGRGAGGGQMPGAGAGMFAEPPADVRARMMEIRERVESMTPQQRREAFEQFQNASPQERERMREEFMRGQGR